MALVLAGTGHRPDKLGGFAPDAVARLDAFAALILDTAQPWRVITGMAQGWDQALAMACIALGIPFTAAVPCDGQERLWPAAARARYAALLAHAAEVVVVAPGAYAPWKMDVRNRWMVDRGDAVLALWDGSKGGTANAVFYARSRAVRVINVFDVWACRRGALAAR